MSLLKKAFSDSSYYLIATIGRKALGFLIIPILARSISVEEFADYDLFLLISAFLQIFVILGIDSGIAILMAESQNDDKKLAFYYVTALIISISTLFILMSFIYVLFFFIDKLFFLAPDIWFLIGLYILFTSINYHTFNFLRWRTEAKKASYINLLAYILGIVIGLVFIYIESGIESYIKGLIIGISIGSLVSLYVAREYLKNFQILDDYKILIKELFQLSLPFVPNAIGGNLMQMVDRVVILILFGKYEVGLYAIIMRLAMIPQFLSTTIVGGFLPVMYKNYNNESGKRLIRNFFHFYLLSIPILFIISYLLSDWLVEIYAGQEYMSIAYLFPMALASILFVGSVQANGFGYTIARKTHYIMYITFLSVFLNFIFSLSSAYFMGIAGVIFGTLLGGIFRIFIHTKYSEKLYSFNYNIFLLVSVSFFTLILSFVIYFYN